jgi:hypothetical protein
VDTPNEQQPPEIPRAIASGNKLPEPAAPHPLGGVLFDKDAVRAIVLHQWAIHRSSLLGKPRRIADFAQQMFRYRWQNDEEEGRSATIIRWFKGYEMDLMRRSR